MLSRQRVDATRVALVARRAAGTVWGNGMLDHIGLTVADFPASRAFYLAALGAIGLELVGEGEDWAMIGAGGRPELWFGRPEANPDRFPRPAIHVAFAVEQRLLVDEFFRTGLAAGGRDNGGPGLRPHYHADYYAAFLLDPDGHNIEAVCHRPS